MAEQEKNKKTINDYREDYYYFTGKASDINRHLIFASIAVVWIFKITVDGQNSIPSELVIVLFWLILSLSLDFLQYFIGSFIWYWFFRYLEKKESKKLISMDDDIKAPEILPFLIDFLFWIKLIVGMIAYFKLLMFLNSNIGIF